MHHTQDTLPTLQFSPEDRRALEDGRIETVTEDGQAAMVVMSPITYDIITRGHIWEQAIKEVEAGEPGFSPKESAERIRANLGLKV